MLAEIKDVRQIPEDGYRRWFQDQDFDLIIWYPNNEQNDIFGFQLCYDKEDMEKALTWTKEHGFQHNKIDTGEDPFSMKKTPTLIADGTFDRNAVLSQFKQASAHMDADIVNFVEATLMKY